MALIEWSNKFSIEINSIDQEHKKLLGYMNELYDELVNGKENEILAEIFKNLEDYTNEHFSHEEKLFKKFNYDKINEHLKSHEFFKSEVKRLKEQIDKENEDAEDLLAFLVDWFSKHIRSIDKEYAPLFKENNVQ